MCRILQCYIKSVCGSGGIRTHAPEETGALNQRLRPLGHATHKSIRPNLDTEIFGFLIEDYLLHKKSGGGGSFCYIERHRTSKRDYIPFK